MYKREFDSLKELPNFLLFFGNGFYLEAYENKILEKFRDDNILKLYYDEFDMDRAITHLNEPSLFGGRNVLIIKCNKVLPKIDKVLKYAKNNSFLFYFYYGNKKINAFKNNFVRFFEPSLKDVIEYINGLEKEFNIKISHEAKLYLSKSVDAIFLKKEIEKLSNYSKEINVEDVKHLVFEYKEESFEELFYLILSNKDFFSELNFFLEKNDFKRIIPALIRYVRDLYMYNLYIKKTGSSSLEGLLGYKLPPNVNKQRVELAIKFKEKEYFELLNFLLTKELEMRSSEKNKETIFWEVISYLKLFNSF